MTIKKFEKIDSWKEARQLMNMVYEITRKAEFSKDFKLNSQIQSAAVSVMSNIAEGFDRAGNKDFIRFLNVAFSSATEVQSQLYVALDQKYILEKNFNKIYEQALTVKKLIAGFIRYLNNKTNHSTLAP